MIRGPALPRSRESLWSLVSARLDSVERGLELVLEDLDCSSGQLGSVDGLARDAAGAPVLLLLAVEGDPLLTARAYGALDFLRRVGDALGHAVPEAALCPGASGRVVLIADGTFVVPDSLVHQEVAGLHVCCLEPFRVGGSDRFVVRWLTKASTAAGVASSDFAIPEHLRPTWTTLHDICIRIDAAVRIDGDRYRRRVTWNGRLLAEVVVADGFLRGMLANGTAIDLAAPADVRFFSDQILRGYARLAGLSSFGSEATGSPDACGADFEARSRQAGNGRSGSSGAAGGSLRTVAAAARLSPEEYSALGSPTSEVGGEAEGAAMADDVARIVAAQERSWPLQGRTD